jgi:predicted Fe-S protein YdhL (DUF1289 family)
MISPCVGICRHDEDRVCLGCKRTKQEIQRWSEMSGAERHLVMERLGYYKRMGREERLRRYDRG